MDLWKVVKGKETVFLEIINNNPFSYIGGWFHREPYLLGVFKNPVN
jgi:hypothetical protein